MPPGQMTVRLIHDRTGELGERTMEKEDRSLWGILAAIVAFSLWYTLTRRSANALWLILAAICFLLLAYRLYGAALAARLHPAERPAGPAGGEHRAGRWVAFGYQFASIAGVSLIIGPALAAQFGYLPGYLWALLAAVAVGGVHDLVVLALSHRRQGVSLPGLVAHELGPWAGMAAWAIFLIAIVAFLAVTGSMAADLLVGNAWGLYAITVTIIVAVLVAMYQEWLRPGHSGEAVALGAALAVLAIAFGSRLANRPLTGGLLANRSAVIALLALYCFVSAALPLRTMTRSRVAMSGYIGLAAVIALAAGIAFAAPSLRQPAVSQFAGTGGPLLPGGVIPYVMIIITAGAITGFNAIAGAGVTTHMLGDESEALHIGYGTLLVQSFFVVAILITVSTLYRWDYYAINTSLPLGEIEKSIVQGQRDWDNMRNLLQTRTVRLPGGALTAPQEDSLRFGGAATTVAAASASMFRDFPGFKKDWLPELYRFMFVLEALLLVPVLEAATRAGRVAIDEMAAVAVHTPPLAGRSGSTTRLAFMLVGTFALCVIWAVLAAATDVMTVYYFLGFTALLVGAIALGTALPLARSMPLRTALGLAFAVVVIAAFAAGVANVRDASVWADALRPSPAPMQRCRPIVWPSRLSTLTAHAIPLFSGSRRTSPTSTSHVGRARPPASYSRGWASRTSRPGPWLRPSASGPPL